MRLVSVVIFGALSATTMAFNFTNPFTGSNSTSPSAQCAQALIPPTSLKNCSSSFVYVLNMNSSNSGQQYSNWTISSLCGILSSCNQTAFTDYANNINSSCQGTLQSNPDGVIADIYYSALSFSPLSQSVCTKNSTGDYCLADIFANISKTQNAGASLSNISTIPANLLCTSCVQSVFDSLNSFVSQHTNVNQWFKNMTPSIDFGQWDSSYHNKCGSASVTSGSHSDYPQLYTTVTILILAIISAAYLSISVV